MLAGQNVTDDQFATQTHEIGENRRELDIHLYQRLLHELHPTGLFFQKCVALTGVESQLKISLKATVNK